MFISKQNKFLAQMFNSKKIEEKQFAIEDKKGKIHLVSNIEALEHFLKFAPKKHQVYIQQLLGMEKYSVKAINKFAYNYAKDYMITLK